MKACGRWKHITQICFNCSLSWSDRNTEVCPKHLIQHTSFSFLLRKIATLPLYTRPVCTSLVAWYTGQDCSYSLEKTSVEGSSFAVLQRAWKCKFLQPLQRLNPTLLSRQFREHFSFEKNIHEVARAADKKLLSGTFHEGRTLPIQLR